jgi:hypothetical protein
MSDACCYVLTDFSYMEWVEGRPFTIDGHAQLAPTCHDNGWSETTDWTATGMDDAQRTRLIAHWTQTARFEHASVASFARFSMQLMAIGAPADLVASATRAQADEIHHARLCLGIASAFADTPIGLGALNIEGALSHAGDVNAILVDTIREACVNETISAAQCQAAAEVATDPHIKDALTKIAEDEQRHAALAWSTVRWILDTHPELKSLAQTTFEDAMSTPWSTSLMNTGDLNPWGVLSSAAEQAIANRVMRRVVRPCVNALLGQNQSQPVTMS